MSWTPERTDTLKVMWTAGHSASEIARKLGHVTRNAVIGKVTRLKLPGRRPPSPLKGRAKASKADKPVKAEKPAPAPKRTAGPMGSLEGHRPNVIKGVQGAQKSGKAVALPVSIKARLKAARAANAAARRVPITELGPRECRYAVNDAGPGGEHLFCGAPVKPGSSYCAAHHGVVYSPAPPRKRKPVSDLDALDAIRRQRVRMMGGL